MIPISTSLIDQCATPVHEVGAKEACSLARQFGLIARWWLEPQVLKRAADHQPAFRPWTVRPDLPNSLGSCWVVCARIKHLPLLRAGFLLPLRWQLGAEHHAALPPPLEHLAKQVVQQFQECRPDRGHRWGLRLHEEAGLENVDLSPLDNEFIEVDSAWAALFGGLALAADQCLPDPSIWATAAWHESFGIGPVGSLEDKLEVALEWKATHLHLPAENHRQALQALTKRRGKMEIELCPLLPVSGNPAPCRLLDQYLARLGVPPPPDAPFQQRRNHYSRVNRKLADEYHWTHLLRDVVQRCREQLNKHHPACQPTVLVTVVSNSPSAVALAPAAASVKRCVLLYERKEDAPILRSRQRVEQFLRDAGIEPLPAAVSVGERADEQREILEHLQRFSRNVSPSQMAFDLTPGYKSLSLALAELAPPDSWLLYCRHKQFDLDNRIDPGTEFFDCWQRK